MDDSLPSDDASPRLSSPECGESSLDASDCLENFENPETHQFSANLNSTIAPDNTNNHDCSDDDEDGGERMNTQETEMSRIDLFSDSPTRKSSYSNFDQD